MFARKAFLSCAVAAAACTLPAVGYGDAPVIQVSPPAPVVEQTPAPREGYLWVPGYWRQDGDRQVWMSGHWERDRNYVIQIHPNREEEEHHWWRRHDRDDD